MFGRLDSLAPRFLVPSARINVLREPKDFYAYLCERIRQAHKRVFLASLYIGRTETGLIEVLDNSLRANSELKVYILTDGLRGTREAPHGASTASLIAPLAAKFPDRVQLYMFRTPKLTRFWELVLPKRMNEGAGLQHMKLYGFDDEILLSGANLSNDYFTNRQDRYISIHDKAVSDYFFRVQTLVSKMSHRVEPKEAGLGPSDNFRLVPPSKEDAKRSSSKLADLLKPQSSSSIKSAAPGTDVLKPGTTIVYPVCQFSPLGFGNELPAMKGVTSDLAANPDYNWLLTAGYFNVYEALGKNLLQSKAAHAMVITASKYANGFYESKGLSSHIPLLYTMMARRFVEQIPGGSKITLNEWRRGTVTETGGWSYHAKGIWAWRANEKPFLTYIGSSNFTKRSYSHDLESGAFLVVPDSGDELRASLASEIDHLREWVGSSRKPEDLDVSEKRLIDKVFVKYLSDRL